MVTNSQQIYARPIWLIIVLAVTPAIGLGICRFAYALVLPDMREALGWSYSTAGLMNTINSAGYLAGALGANAVIRRIGMFDAIRISAAACLISLVLSTVTGSAAVFAIARLIAGIAAALSFVSGGALASHVAQAQLSRQAFYLSLFYVGPAIGILISGFVAPLVLAWFGPGSWWLVWTALAAISGAMALVLPTARLSDPPATAQATQARISASPILPYLIGYALFGAGYIAYMTFMIAYVRNAGGDAVAQGAFWTCIGTGAFIQPWVWGSAMAKARSGRLTALLIAMTAIGALIPLFGHSPLTLAISAFLFGNAFFAVVSSTAAFTRLNYPPCAWPKTLAMMTVAFGVGQTCGPIVTGAITDLTGSLSYALSVSAGALVGGAIACMMYAAKAPSRSGGVDPVKHGRRT